MTKEFKKAGVLRILLGVPKEVAIGAIIESELFKKSDLEKIVDQLVDLLPIPSIVFAILPELLLDLKLFIIALTWKWINLLPGDDFEFPVPEFFEEVPLLDETPGIYDGDELVTQEDYNTLVEEIKVLSDNYKILLEDYNTLKGEKVDPSRSEIINLIERRIRTLEGQYDDAFRFGWTETYINIEQQLIALDNILSEINRM